MLETFSNQNPNIFLCKSRDYLEDNEGFLKEEFDYPILDRPGPKYIPEKLNLIASKKGELIHDFGVRGLRGIECRDMK